MIRKCDFEERRKHLANLSDDELKKRFWQLTDKVVTPLFEMAQKHTSPSIERSVLLRMGFNSLEARKIVDKCVEYGLLGKGAGHVVWKMAKVKGISIREAGEQLMDDAGWEFMKKYFSNEGSGEYGA